MDRLRRVRAGRQVAERDRDRARGRSRARRVPIGRALALTAALLAVQAAPALASPLAPSHVQIVWMSAHAVGVSWTAPPASAEHEAPTGYEVLRNGEAVGTTDGYTTNFLDTTISARGVYEYTVVATAGANRSPASGRAPVYTPTSTEATTITECQAGALPSGHYVLSGDLVVRPGHPCLQFHDVEDVSLDCQGHAITDEADSQEPALTIEGVKRFIVVNCGFEMPDGANAPTLVSVLDSESGVLADDSFAAREHSVWVKSNGDREVFIAHDLMKNASPTEERDEGDYFGTTTVTEPSQWPNGVLSIAGGAHNVIDANDLQGDADLNGYPRQHRPTESLYELPLHGVDDVINYNGGSEEVIANNHISDAFDCGIETANLIDHAVIAGNVISNAWAAGICSYKYDSWLESAIVDNAVSYSGVLLTLGDESGQLATGQPRDYMYANRIERNTLAHAEWHIWDYAAMLTPWLESELGVPVQAGENAFIDNDFGSSLPAPYLNAKDMADGIGVAEYPSLVEPHLVGEQSGNECVQPSPYLACSEPQPILAQQPVVAGVYPARGPEAGGTLVAIQGSGLTGASEVRFGGAPARIKSALGDSRVLVEAPSGAAGAVDVTVRTPAGTSTATPTDRFTYGRAPVLNGLSPAQGTPAGGTRLTISGQGFTGATAVAFGTAMEHSCATSGPPCFTVTSDGSISATSEPDTDHLGFANVTVTTPAGTSDPTEGILLEQPNPAADSEFTYSTVTSLQPSSGPATGGTRVRIIGEDLCVEPSAGDEVVRFGSATATDVEVKSCNEIVATAPAGHGAVDVSVSTRGGTSVRSAADQFTYTQPQPVVSSVQAAVGPEAGGSQVTISGQHLEWASAVAFGATAASTFEVKSPTEIRATAPAGAGTVDVTVTTPGGTSAAVAADQFAYYIGGPFEGLAFKAAVPAAGEMAVSIRSEGPGFPIGPLTSSGVAGQTAKLALDTPEPAFEERAKGQYVATGGGIQTSVEGLNAAGEPVVGPLTAACTVPRTLVVAEIPVGAGEGERQYTTSYSAECVLGPGVSNYRSAAAVSFVAFGPQTVERGHPFTLPTAQFTVGVPRQWREALLAMGATQVRGTSRSEATAVLTG